MDYAGLEGTTTMLTCTRDGNGGRVVWETLDNDGKTVMTIYDSEDGTEPAPETGYEMNIEGNDFGITITYSQTTAIMTRCSITEEAKLNVDSSAMIYLIGMLCLPIIRFNCFLEIIGIAFIM